MQFNQQIFMELNVRSALLGAGDLLMGVRREESPSPQSSQTTGEEGCMGKFTVIPTCDEGFLPASRELESSRKATPCLLL